MILLSPYIQSVLIVESIIFLLCLVGLFWAVKISLYFNPKSTTSKQYNLNKKSYLVATIIKFALIVKLPFFLFYIWTMDTISEIVPGAMCAAGIVSATEFGPELLMIKLLILFGLFAWLLLHSLDINEVDYPYTKLKFIIFQPICILIGIELFMEVYHFMQISTDVPVHCCSVVFEQSSAGTASLMQNEPLLLVLFYSIFIASLIFGLFKKAILFSISSLAFMFVGIQTLIRFFSSYVYELPTHKCPFCLLQSDYYYVGYLIYVLFFIGASMAVNVFILYLLKKTPKKSFYKISIIANTLLVVILSLYPIIYYIKNGVWL